MKNVKVNKTELVKRVSENREKHRKEFEEGLETYKAAVIKELEEWMEKAKAGKKVRAYTQLTAPEDHSDDYDQVLDMLAMSVDDEIDLTYQEFSQYVRDDWGWKQQFTNTIMSNSAYVES